MTKNACILIALFFFSLPMSGQQLAENFTDNLETWYGPNDLLVNGTAYQASHPFAKGHPYYLYQDWILGTVYMSGKSFPNEFIRYDVERNVLLLKKKLNETGNEVHLILNEALVDSFVFDAKKFIKNTWVEASPNGFLSVIYRGDFNFFIRYSKEFLGTYSISSPSGRYSLIQQKYFWEKAGELIPIQNKKELLNQFPLHKKAIKKHMRQSGFSFSNASPEQWLQLLNFCDELS